LAATHQGVGARLAAKVTWNKEHQMWSAGTADGAPPEEPTKDPKRRARQSTGSAPVATPQQCTTSGSKEEMPDPQDTFPEDPQAPAKTRTERSKEEEATVEATDSHVLGNLISLEENI